MYLFLALVDEGYYYGTIGPGPAFGVAVVAWLLSTAAAITVLVLWRRAGRGQDGPCRSCCCKSNAVPPTFGTV